jgi:hypothetical protein
MIDAVYLARLNGPRLNGTGRANAGTCEGFAQTSTLLTRTRTEGRLSGYLQAQAASRRGPRPGGGGRAQAHHVIWPSRGVSRIRTGAAAAGPSPVSAALTTLICSSRVRRRVSHNTKAGPFYAAIYLRARLGHPIIANRQGNGTELGSGAPTTSPQLARALLESLTPQAAGHTRGPDPVPVISGPGGLHQRFGGPALGAAVA